MIGSEGDQPVTTWDVLRAIARRWPVAALGAVATLVITFQVFTAPGVFLTSTDIYISPPRGASPTQMGQFTDSTIAVAGLVERRVNEGSEPRAVSPDVTLVDMGIYDGAMVTLPNSGGQWTYSFAEPRLHVSAAASTAGAAEALRRRTSRKVERELASLQDQIGVPSRQRYVARQIPAMPQVSHLRGRRSVAAAMSLALGLGVTVFASVQFDRMKRVSRGPERTPTV